MFKILCRITDQEEFLRLQDEETFFDGDIHGFFALKVNDKFFGHYHDRPLGDHEEGWYAITSWLISLGLAYQQLFKGGYVAINCYDSIDLWIEFKKHDGVLLASLLESDKVAYNAKLLSLVPPPGFVYGDWTLEAVSYQELYEQLVEKMQFHLSELESINPKILAGKKFIKLAELLNEVRELGVIV